MTSYYDLLNFKTKNWVNGPHSMDESPPIKLVQLFATWMVEMTSNSYLVQLSSSSTSSKSKRKPKLSRLQKGESYKLMSKQH